MANYLGVLPTIELISAIPPEWRYVEYERDLLNAGAGFYDDFSKAGSFNYFKFFSKTKTMNGVQSYSYSNIFYNNYWIVPFELDLGVVTKDLSYIVYVFNGYLSDKVLEDIKNTVPQVDLTHGNLPETFLPTQEKQYPLLVHAVGNPNISGSIQFIFSDYTFTINIIGQRIVIFPFDCISELSIKHIKSVAKSQTRYLQQERRRLTDRVMHGIQCTIVRTDMSLEAAMAFAQGKIFAFPILVEEILPDSSYPLQGNSVIHLATDITNYLEFKDCKYIMLYDGQHSEVGHVQAVSNNQINLDTPISHDFDPSETKIYPIILVWLENFSQRRKSKNVNEYDLFFIEANLND